MEVAAGRPFGQPRSLYLRDPTTIVTVFVDTLYWVAVTNRADPWHSAALDAKASLGGVHLITTQEVLAEFLAALSGHGAHLRRAASKIAGLILRDSDTTVVPQSDESFRGGLKLYEERPDKAYSLTDCISMNAMRTRKIAGILTNDHHFSQEGFEVLIRR